MRRFTALSVLSLLLAVVGCQAEGIPSVSIDVDYGNLKLDGSLDSGLVSVVIRNSGDGMLVIDTVSTSCGMRVEKQPQEVVYPDSTTTFDLVILNRGEKFDEQVVMKTNSNAIFNFIDISGTYK